MRTADVFPVVAAGNTSAVRRLSVVRPTSSNLVLLASIFYSPIEFQALVTLKTADGPSRSYVFFSSLAIYRRDFVDSGKSQR